MSSTLALDLIWRRLNRPFNLEHAVPALTGFPASDVAHLVALHLAVSAEAEVLLDATPTLLRTLSSSTTTEPSRGRGDIRGPVMWSETLTARANTFGADDVFVCATPRRDHDISENRVLVAALVAVARAERALTSPAVRYFDETRRERIERNAATAKGFLRHKHLSSVRRATVGSRELHKVSSGRRASHYSSAIALLRRRVEPLRGSELHTLCDARTIAQHHALVLVMASLQRRGLVVPQFRAVSGELVAGRLRYRNWRTPTSSGNHGILLDQVLIDAPDTASAAARSEALADLERRAGGRIYCLVSSMEEAELAVDLALAATRSEGVSALA